MSESHDPHRRIRDQMNLETFLFGVPPRSMQDVPVALAPDMRPGDVVVLSHFRINPRTLEVTPVYSEIDEQQPPSYHFDSADGGPVG